MASSSSSPVKNQPDNTYSGIDDFRRSIFHDENAPPLEEEKGGVKFLKKAKQNPMVPIGIAGGLSALFYSAYKFKTRDPTTKLSVYLIHTRMAAQGAVVSALTLGVLYSMFNEYFRKPEANLPVPNTPGGNKAPH